MSSVYKLTPCKAGDAYLEKVNSKLFSAKSTVMEYILLEKSTFHPSWTHINCVKVKWTNILREYWEDFFFFPRCIVENVGTWFPMLSRLSRGCRACQCLGHNDRTLQGFVLANLEVSRFLRLCADNNCSPAFQFISCISKRKAVPLTGITWPPLDL